MNETSKRGKFFVQQLAAQTHAEVAPVSSSMASTSSPQPQWEWKCEEEGAARRTEKGVWRSSMSAVLDAQTRACACVCAYKQTSLVRLAFDSMQTNTFV